jgi:arsenate reductase|tara:strand:+ start:35 stop:322 length:288 start_codon:yes stop_codon:yes gene_type:complete
LRDNGIEPKIIEYLKEIPTKEDFQRLAKMLGKKPAEFIRKGELLFKENNVKEIMNDDSAMFEAMNRFPKIMERPIVVKGNKAVLGRPPESVLGLL